jgi:hypothetical protein
MAQTKSRTIRFEIASKKTVRRDYLRDVAAIARYEAEHKREDEADILNVGQALEAVARLLQFATDAGNEPLDGFVALGLGRLLELIAERVR